jgi:Pentapeptide repeats (8 copies)
MELRGSDPVAARRRLSTHDGSWVHLDRKPDRERRPNLIVAILTEANLSWANLSGAKLLEANLYGAQLDGAGRTSAGRSSPRRT